MFCLLLLQYYLRGLEINLYLVTRLGCIAVFSIMLFACMYEIRGEESL